MNKEQLIKYIKDPKLLNEHSLSGLKELIEDYPFFEIARILYLKNLKNIDSYKLEPALKESMIYIKNRKHLFEFLNDDYTPLQLQTKATHELNQKNNLNFEFDLTEISHEPFRLEEFIEKEPQDLKNSKKYDLIDRFIEESPSMPVIDPKTNLKTTISEENNEHSEDLMTETLANIYIKQGYYKKAIDAFEKLSLKFPEKNSYFASQIEEIKELMTK